MKSKFKFTLAAAVLLLATACGSDDDDDGSATTDAGTAVDAVTTAPADTAVGVTTAPPDTASGDTATNGGPTGGTLTISDLGSATVSFDPGQSSFNVRQYLYPVYDPLIRRSGDGEYHPSLATEWEYTSPTEFHLTLRDDVTFADGTPFDGDVVKKNLEAVSKSTGPLASQLKSIQEVVVNSPTDVTIKLSTPVPSMPIALSSTVGLMVHPDHVAGPELASEAFGTGPYTLDAGKTIVNDTYVYDKRADHWQSDKYPYDTVIVKVISDPQAVINALRNNEVQVGVLTSSQDANTAEEAGLELQEAPYNVDGVQLYDRAGKVVAALADQRVRQAMNYAIDRKAIVESIELGKGTPTAQLLKPGFPGYDAALDDAYPYDVDKAKALMKDAGYEDGFEMSVVNISLFDPQMQAMAAMWGDIGITVNIEDVPPNQYIPSIISGEYPAAYLPYGIVDTFFDLPQLVLPDGGFNPFHSEDAEITKLYEDAKTVDDTKRDELYKQINQRVVDLAWFVPIHTTPLYMATTKSVTGVEFSVVFPQPFYDWRPAG